MDLTTLPITLTHATTFLFSSTARILTGAFWPTRAAFGILSCPWYMIRSPVFIGQLPATKWSHTFAKSPRLTFIHLRPKYTSTLPWMLFIGLLAVIVSSTMACSPRRTSHTSLLQNEAFICVGIGSFGPPEKNYNCRISIGSHCIVRLKRIHLHDENGEAKIMAGANNATSATRMMNFDIIFRMLFRLGLI